MIMAGRSTLARQQDMEGGQIADESVPWAVASSIRCEPRSAAPTSTMSANAEHMNGGSNSNKHVRE
jgi:hypothetical protein